jgi:hypothetical protein
VARGGTHQAIEATFRIERARLIAGLALGGWMGDSGVAARGRLVHHMGTLGVPGPVLRRMHAEDGS